MTTGQGQCWSCGKPRAPEEPLCPSCGKVQAVAPAGTLVDKFALLGLPQSFDLDLQMLEERHRALSRKVHPDKVGRGDPRERRYALEQTAQLNDAVRVLKDEAARAQHLLALQGVDASGEDGQQVPHEFLEEAMADRERLMDAKFEGGPEAVVKLGDEQRSKRAETLQKLSQSLREERWQDASQLVQRLRYHARFLDDVEGRERGLD